MKISYNQYKQHINKMYIMLNKIKHNLTDIVAIHRGGLLLGLELSHRLDLPLHVLDPNKPFNYDEFKNKTILLVDDISDTGNTFTKITSKFKRANIYTAAVFIGENTSYIPHFYTTIIKNKEWVYMPFELWEKK